MSNLYVDGVPELGQVKAESIQLGSVAEGLLTLAKIEEEVTIVVGSGADPVVTTTGNLAPANSIIVGGSFVVTQAPGGGATELDIGTAGDPDLLIDGMSCNVLGESGRFFVDGEAVAVGTNGITPLVNKTATTLTLTTDADVAVSDMKVLVTVWYETVTPPA